MADLDEISLMIGEIRADMRHALKWFDEHEARDQERFELLSNQHERLIDRIGNRIEKCEEQLVDTKPVIDGIRKTKWIVAGFVTAVALVGGAVGGKAETILRWFV